MTAELPWLCRKLRWKSHSVDVVELATVCASLAQGGQSFTCLSTADAVGEDGGPVAYERCHARRRCYAVHPLIERRRLPVV